MNQSVSAKPVLARACMGTPCRVVVACLLGWLALGVAGPAGASAEPALPPGFQDEVAFGNLEQPTTFRFAPDERIFVAEKSGLIEVYDDLDDASPDLFADLRTDVYDHGDRGLLGLALDPEFSTGSPYVYALYTYDHILGELTPPPRWGLPATSGDECSEPKGADDCVVSGRLVRLTAAEGTNHAVPSAASPGETVLAEDWCQQFSSHSIGDLQFGPEGALYASGGDGASFTGIDFGQLGTPPNPCGDPPGGFGVALAPPTAEGGALRSQNLHNLSGKIIRVDPDTGEGWPDNPLHASLDADTRRIVAYGFRNPFRFTIDSQTGEIYTGNVGSSELEEIDRFPAPPKATYNSGWPCYEGPGRQYLFKTLGLNVCEALYAGEPASTSSPLFYYSHAQEVVPGDECSFASGSAIGGVGFYEGSDFPPAYEGALFFADAVRGCIYAMLPGADGRPDPDTTIRFLREAQIYPGVDIEEGPDGALYYATLCGDEECAPGAIHRITYAPGSPTARLSADPQWGPVDPDPLQVELDATESSDPAEEPLTYAWDLDGDGEFEAPGSSTRTVEFTKAEVEEAEAKEESPNRIVAVRVSDGEALRSVARVTVYPGDEPPQPTIDAPSEDVTWSVGDAIHFAGTALDFEGHHLPGLSFRWSMRIAHCPNPSEPLDCHKHPLQTVSGQTEGSFIAPEHDYPSYIEITLRAADERGLTASETVKIQPRTVDLALASEPGGIPLAAGLLATPAPFTLTTIEGSNVTLAAPQAQSLGGRTYTFSHWSDGGARSHTVLADADASYEAFYTAPPDAPPATPTSAPTKPVHIGFPPVSGLRLNAHPARKTRSTTARFTFASKQHPVRFQCQLDRGRFLSCRSPALYTALKPGKHTFRVAATAHSGERVVRSFAWTILPRP